MATFNILMPLVLLMLSNWKIISSEGIQNLDDTEGLSEQDMFHLKDNRLGQNIPNMRLVLNNLLRYENSFRHPVDSDPMATLSSGNKGTVISADDPLAVLATGFHGSRGKRPSYNDLPVFANGFPANRGRK